MNDLRAAFTAACRACGIHSLVDFHERFGVDAATLGLQAALILAATPDWVTAIWIPNAGQTPVVWIPEAVRRHASVFAITQDPGESDHAFTTRLQAAITEQQKNGGHNRGPPPVARPLSSTASSEFVRP